MIESEARCFIQGKLNCMERCDRFDCENTYECDNCEYCYSQGTFGEQKEAFHMAIKALEKQDKIKEIIANANQWSKEDVIVKAQAFCEIEAIMKE